MNNWQLLTVAVHATVAGEVTCRPAIGWWEGHVTRRPATWSNSTWRGVRALVRTVRKKERVRYRIWQEKGWEKFQKRMRKDGMCIGQWKTGWKGNWLISWSSTCKTFWVIRSINLGHDLELARYHVCLSICLLKVFILPLLKEFMF